ncbi:MAG TPA: DUF5131 family protein [Amycolatopsis sp.]|uniref:DUF5131 family protein n=1 Tax=Amycolatopsis sp. TaxID=37632 RepID=UPI002B461356|nr:DUF5131 family protein [Amycolatopsis sp.]HKS46739.1 DUF5131 family protein [Amycolatopsis sp.]
MVQLGPYEVHPFADAFPLIDGEEFAELAADVKRNGLRDPILLSHDKTTLIDGRNRYRACEAAGVDPVFETLGRHYTEPMILDLIVSKNLVRRQLNPGQRALMALEYEKYYSEANKPGAPIGNQNASRSEQSSSLGAKTIPADLPEPRRERESRERAAKVTGASGRAVQQAKAIRRDSPDLAEKVRTGALALDAADRQRRERVRAMPKPDPAPKPSQVLLTLRTHTGEEVQYPQPKAKPTFNETPGEGISWAAWSWNPVTGCLHGCDYCYAREIATSERTKAAYPVGFTPLFHHERLDAPANTTIPAAHRDDPAYRKVFVCSMADLYGRWVPDEWIEQVHSSMLASPWWQYILLTKFPARYVGLDLPPKAWVGTSIDEQKRVRIAEDAFRKIDGVAVKWLSLEPLREPLEFTDLSMFDWVVIGAQTETRQPDGTVTSFAPPFEWVARIALRAKEAGCKVHLKPNLLGRVSPQLPGMRMLDEHPGPGGEEDRS